MSRAISSLEGLPDGVRKLVESAFRRVAPRKVILFGSQARGDARPDSDFDIALVFEADRSAEWTRFVADAGETTLTLRAIDWVDFNEASKDLQREILATGKVLYEQAALRLG